MEKFYNFKNIKENSPAKPAQSPAISGCSCRLKGGKFTQLNFSINILSYDTILTNIIPITTRNRFV